MRRSTDVRECVGLEIHKQYVCALFLVLEPRREPGAKGQGMRIPGRKEVGRNATRGVAALVRDETSRDIVMWSFIISSSRFTLARRHPHHDTQRISQRKTN